ncbi:MAG: hypothetical protein SFX73_03565 [Kofleriaceae bacterium]|nr:hypothetical protein [Kofleriaceae bacterium]
MARSGIAVDAMSRVHVLYEDEGRLMYGTVDSDRSWTTRELDADGIQGSLAIDASGRVHISYLQGEQRDLRYGLLDAAATWSSQLVASRVAFGTAMAVDAAGRAHITYYVGAALYHSALEGDRWVASTVDANVGFRGLDEARSAIAIDGAGQLHIAYYDGVRRGVRYAHGRDGVFSIESVEPTSAASHGEFLSMNVDRAGGVHLAYVVRVSNVRRTLRYAYRSPAGAYRLTAVESGDRYDYGETAIVADDRGGVHLLYRHTVSADSSLMYEYRDGSGRRLSEQLDGSWPLAGYAPAIALDRNGGVHVVSNRRTRGQLHYTFRYPCRE